MIDTLVTACANYHRLTAPIRHAIRHHWHVGHHAARVAFYGGHAVVVPVLTISGAACAGAHWPVGQTPAMGTLAVPVAVPEPAGIMAMGVALLVLAACTRRGNTNDRGSGSVQGGD